MKRLNLIKFLVLIVSILMVMPAGAVWGAYTGATTDPSDIGVGARPMGMGKAYVAISDAGGGIFINPAGLAGIKTPRLSSMYTSFPIGDTSYTAIEGAYPFAFGTLGVGYINVSTGGIPLVTAGSTTPEAYTSYGEGLVVLSYSTELKRLWDTDITRNISVGANLKYFMKGFSGSGPTISMDQASGTGIDIDLGIQYQPLSWLTLALCQQNTLPFNMGGKFTWQRNNIEEGIPSLTKIGGAFKIIGKESPITVDEQELTVAVDMDISPKLPRPTAWHVGAEWWPLEFFALRLGIDQKPKAWEEGGVPKTGVDSNLTAGVGLKVSGFTFDYAYHQYGDISENTTHYFSFGYVGEEEKPPVRVIKPRPEPEPEVPKARVPEIRPIVKPRLPLKTFSDVWGGYWAKEPIEYLATLGIIGGYPDGTFRPERSLTRAEMAVLLVKAREVELPAVVTADVFVDLPRTHWAAKYVKEAVVLNLVGGYPDGTFKPSKPLTRDEAVVLISRFDGISPAEVLIEGPFPDLPLTHWSAPTVAAAKQDGLLEYLAGENFNHDQEITRAEAAEMLSKTRFAKERIRDLLGEE